MYLGPKSQKNNEVFYDFYEDFDLIDASVTAQYGIRIRQEANSITWSEVKVLIKGLLPETPLGKVIAIRSENDPKVLKTFSKALHEERNSFRKRMADKKVDNGTFEEDMQKLENFFKVSFQKK